MVLLFAVAAAAQGMLPDLADPCAEPLVPGTFEVVVDGDDGVRTGVVYVPEAPGPVGSRPLVVALHGGGQVPMGFVEDNDLQVFAAERGAVLVAARGTGGVRLSWNAGNGCCGEAHDPELEDGSDGVDDVAYLDGLVAAVASGTCTDRVLAMGFSAGGMMAHRWAWERPTADAVVSMAGPLRVMDDTPGAVPVWHVHGDADTDVPEGGLDATPDRHGYPAAEQVMEAWCQRNGCADTFDSYDEYPEGPYWCRGWDASVDTRWCTILDHGHSWPGYAEVFGILGRRAMIWFEGLPSEGD